MSKLNNTLYKVQMVFSYRIECRWSDVKYFTKTSGLLSDEEPAAMQEMQAWSLCQEDLLEKGMATLPSILAWEIPQTEEPRGYSLWGHEQ